LVSKKSDNEVLIFDLKGKEKRENIFFSGGIKLFISGQNLDVVQKPMMKSIYNSSIFEFISVSRQEKLKSEKLNLFIFFYRHVNLFQFHK